MVEAPCNAPIIWINQTMSNSIKVHIRQMVKIGVTVTEDGLMIALQHRKRIRPAVLSALLWSFDNFFYSKYL